MLIALKILDNELNRFLLTFIAYNQLKSHNWKRFFMLIILTYFYARSSRKEEGIKAFILKKKILFSKNFFLKCKNFEQINCGNNN